MSVKCTHTGCGKLFDPDAPRAAHECLFHPQGPEFHEGQKGWRCCRPRVLTFDEFLDIPPCTRGHHSAEAPVPVEKPPQQLDIAPVEAAPRLSVPAVTPTPDDPSAPEKKKEDLPADDPARAVPPGSKCRRSGCAQVAGDSKPRDLAADECWFHPGAAVFHEGAKGWACCRRRVLEFDEFLGIRGCVRAPPTHGHLFHAPEPQAVKNLPAVRHEFYQSAADLTVTVYLKHIDAARARVAVDGVVLLGAGAGEAATPAAASSTTSSVLELDLPTADGARFADAWTLHGALDPAACAPPAVTPNKLELVLRKKTRGVGWPALTARDGAAAQRAGVRVQVAPAGSL